MTQIKRKLNRFAFYDRKAIEAHTEAMAEKGWMVEQPGNLLWRYRRIQPKKLHIAVTYFPKASAFDPAPTDGQQRMEELCAKDGWLPAARWGQMQIFYNEAEDPTPIETDAVTQVETIHRAMKRNMLPHHFALLALCIYQLVFLGWQLFSGPVDFLSASTSLYMLAAWMLLLFSTLLEVGCYFRWHHSASAAAEKGVFLDCKPNRIAGWVLLALAFLLIALPLFNSAAKRWTAVLLFTGIFLTRFAVVKISGRMKRKGASRTVNRTVSAAVSAVLTVAFLSAAVFAILHSELSWNQDHTPVGRYVLYGREFQVYDDPLPLQIEDFLEIPGMYWSREAQREETFLLSNTEYFQWPLTEDPVVPSLEYTVTHVKAPSLYGICKAGLLNAAQDEVLDGGEVFIDHYEPIDPAPWGAVEAYRHHWSDGVLNRYLLCYDNRLVEIRFDWEPAPEQAAVVGEKLGGA